MPADEDYGRRQVTLQHASTSPAPVPCPAGCPAAPVDHVQTTIAERYQSTDRQERYSSDKQIAAAERFEPSDRFQVVPDRFGSERSSSDRLPSGERYHGGSERYPLGERPQTAISSDRLTKEILQGSGQNFQPERYHYVERNCQRYPERYQAQNVGSLDRYHNGVMDRYSRTNTPTDRYLSAGDKERCNSSNADRYSQDADFNAGAASAQSICSIERYTPTSERQRFNQTSENYNNGSKTLPSEVYKIRSNERKQSLGERYQRYAEYDRFLPIPCPERFAGTQERTERPDRVQFSQVSYMEPPSPAPSSDRFIPPPPLSPTNTPSPDCYPANAFPSPTTAAPAPDRFIPPPPLSPSPTENFSPKKLERYEKRYQYTASPNPNDRYSHYDRSNKERQYYNPANNSNDRYLTTHQNQSSYHDRFGSSNNSTERYIPPNAHVPVERYVPQQQENYYGSYQSYDRYQKFNANDPYMRRDLGFYRLTVPYPQNQFQRIRYSHMCTPNRAKCCQFQDAYHVKSSPGSSSSSSVTSQGNKDLQNFHAAQKELGVVNNSNIPESIQCQNYHGKEYQCAYQQEKGVQCSAYATSKDFQCIGFHIAAGKDGKEAVCATAAVGFNSPSMRKGQCRHGICGSSSVEYVGQSGGRHVCATPPPRGSVGSADIVICSDQCCTKRPQNTLALTVW